MRAPAYAWMYVCMDPWVVDGCTDGRTEGGREGGRDGWMDVFMCAFILTCCSILVVCPLTMHAHVYTKLWQLKLLERGGMCSSGQP